MSDLIDRQKAMDALNHELRCGAVINQCGLEAAYEVIEDLPTAEPQERTGKWIYHIDDLFPTESTMECSECHEHQYLTCDDNFCPNCGCKMEMDNE